ncbi:MAG TPA: hypothetical protein VMX12_06735, partial [Acidimicrobiia bacterium]|nr:hypothetical protein [Acidimicrobiia bacterium]
MRRLITLAALLLAALPAFGQTYTKYEETMTAKRAGSTLLEVLPGASVSVYKPGCTISAASISTTLTIYSCSKISASDTIEVDGQAATVVTVDSATQLTIDSSVTAEVGDRVLRTGDEVTIYTDPAGTSAITQPTTANSNGRVMFYFDSDTNTAFDLKATLSSTKIVMGDEASAVGGGGAVSLTHLFLDATDYGAVCDGTTTGDDVGIQSSITAAEATSNEAAAGTQLFEGGTIVQLPAGECILDAALTITSSNVSLIGAGKDRTTLVMNNGTQAIDSDINGSDRMGNPVFRGFSITYDDQHNALATAPSADTTAMYLYYPNKPIIEDVKVYFPDDNEIEGLIGIDIARGEPGAMRDVEVHNATGASSGNDATCLKFTNATDNRGNWSLSNVFLLNCQIGLWINDTNGLWNSAVFDNVKIVNLDDGTGVAGTRNYKYGVYVVGGAGFTFNGLHVEGSPDDGANENSFDKCVFFNGSRAHVLNAPLTSYCEVGYDFQGSDYIMLNNPLVGASNDSNNEDFDPLFDLSDGTSEQVHITGLKVISTANIWDYANVNSATDSLHYLAWADTGVSPGDAGTDNERMPLYFADPFRAHSFGIGIGQSATIGYGSSSIQFDVDGGGAEYSFSTTALTTPASATPGFAFYDTGSSSVTAGSLLLNMTDVTTDQEDTDFTLSAKVFGSDEDFLAVDASEATVVLGTSNVDAIVGTVCTAAA